jgi:predicted nucleic acid-binding protein
MVSEIALIADTSGLYALYDSDDEAHEQMTAAYDAEATTLIVPALVAVEVDYLITKRRLGIDAELTFIDDLRESYQFEPPTSEDLARARALIDQYRGLNIGLVDATIMALAERFRCRRILGRDARHFLAVRPSLWDSFVLVPGG